MARTAQNNVAMLFPRGCVQLEEIPSDLYAAIQHANVILSWFDNLSKDEQPPEWMWPFSEELTDYFEELRLSKSGGSDADYSDLDQNEFAKNLK